MSARRRGLLRLSVLLVAVVGVVVLVAHSQGGSSGGEQGGMPKVTDSTPAKPMSVRLVARTSPQHLPAPISGEAAVASRDGVLSIGGLDSNTVSTSSVVELRPPDGKARARSWATCQCPARTSRPPPSAGARMCSAATTAAFRSGTYCKRATDAA